MNSNAAAPQETDPLLAELQGLAVGVKKIDPDVPAAPPRDLQLDTKAAAPVRTHTETMDSKFSTAAGGAGYRVRLRGKYFAKVPGSDKEKTLVPYALDVNVTKLEGCLSVIKNRLLDPMLRKHPVYGRDYVAFQTHEIVEVTPLGGTPPSTNLQFMSREQLVAHIKERRAPIRPEDYSDVVALRDAVIDWTLSPHGFEEREARRQADRLEQQELARLNPGLADADTGAGAGA